MKKASIRLRYLSVKEIKNAPREPKAQPCVVHPDGRKPFRVVPIAQLVDANDLDMACIGCVGEHSSHNNRDIDCGLIPDCANTIYVRATPANKLKHIAWLLENN